MLGDVSLGRVATVAPMTLLEFSTTETAEFPVTSGSPGALISFSMVSEPLDD